MDEQRLKNLIRQILFREEGLDLENAISSICHEFGIGDDDLRDLLNQTDDLEYIVDRVLRAEAGDLHRTRQQLIDIVDRIVKGEGTKGEIDEWFRVLGANVPMPISDIVDLIFHPAEGVSLTPDEIVDKALNYKPEVTLL